MYICIYVYYQLYIPLIPIAVAILPQVAENQTKNNYEI